MESTTINNHINAIKTLENFLMNLEVTFYLKKQRETEKNFIKNKQFIIF